VNGEENVDVDMNPNYEEQHINDDDDD